MSDMPKIEMMLKNHARAGHHRDWRAADGLRPRRRSRMPCGTPRARRFAACRCSRTRSCAAPRAEKSGGTTVKAFAYVNPANEKEAIAALQGRRHRAADCRRLGPARADEGLPRFSRTAWSTSRALDARSTSTPDGGLRIGAAVKIVDLAEHAAVTRLFPAVVAAADPVGSPQIRNQGTVGGNINQRPRCWYFRNEEFVCFKKGGSRCFAVDGENQFHAIFGETVRATSSIRRAWRCRCVAYGAKFRVVGPKASARCRRPSSSRCRRWRICGKENVLRTTKSSRT